MYETIKKFLFEGGKCLIIEDGKPVGVVLTMEEYKKLSPPQTPPYQGGDKGEVDQPKPIAINPIGSPAKIPEKISVGKEIIKERDLSNVKIDELDFGLSSDDITLEDLGLDEVSE